MDPPTAETKILTMEGHSQQDSGHSVLGDPVKHIDTSTLTPTHRFVVPKRRPKMHQNTPFVGVPLVKARSPVHIHELGVSVENGHFLFVHDIINTSQYRLDVSSMHKRDVNEKEARNYLDWGFPGS